jgi:hypothetical protein
LEKWALGSLSVALYLDAYHFSSTFHPKSRYSTLKKWAFGFSLSLSTWMPCSSPFIRRLLCSKGVRQNPDSDLAAQKPDIVLLLKFGRKCVTPLAVNFSQIKSCGFSGKILCFSSANLTIFLEIFANFSIEISLNSRKDRVSTPSLVIHRVRFKKNLQKSTLAFIQGKWFPEFHPVFLFS